MMTYRQLKKSQMKKLYFLFLFIFIAKYHYSQIAYTFAGVGGSFTYNTAPTVLHASSVDDVMSASTAIGFTFQYGCVNYTTFQASSNGFLCLGTTGAFSDAFNDLTNNSDRPIIAPLWDDLKTGTGGNVNYKLTGFTPFRVLTIEWKQMLWNYSATTWGVSAQVKLYETSNRIEFIYDRNGGPATNLNTPSASIGLGGSAAGDFYSLDGTGGAPTASKAVETTTLATKPSNGQIYRWDPILCSGIPSAGTAVATPSANCGAFTTTLTLTGSSIGCGLTYLWYQSNAAAGPYTAIGSATSVSTQTYAIVAGVPKFFKCVLTCVSSSTSAVISASVNAASAGAGSYSVSIPYSTSGKTTCGFGDDITATNVTNVCGSSSYYTGEDVVYIFTPTVTAAFSASVNSTGSYMGMNLYQGCPISGGICVANAQSSAGNQTFNSSSCPSAVTVSTGVTYYLVLDSYASPTCNPYDLTITTSAVAASTVVPCNMAYTVSSPVFNFEAISGTVLPTTDDVLFSSVVLFGFPVCFDGFSFNGGYVASNAAFVFDAVPCFPNIQTTTYAAGGVSTGYTISGPAPINNTSIPRNAILAPWHDINPALGGVIQYTVLGAAPNRRFILSYENIPMYSCGTSSPTIYHSSQIKIYETSNNIEIHVKQKKVCPGWNNGQAVLGLQNFDGTIYTPPVNATVHNATASSPYNQWTMTNTAYRFSTTCGASSTCGLTLPIGMKSFYGERVDKINNLYWETATEENLKKYKIQRSTDAVNFIEIGQVTPNNSPSKYSFEDRNAALGVINYYRIATYENDGTYSYTSIISLGNGNNEILNASQIYPNPVNSSFSIALDSKQKGSATINVYDVFGRLVKSSNNDVHGGVTQYEIFVDDLKFGVYYVEVLNSFNEVISKQKFIKN